jgi:hypothetical protein
MFRDAAKTENGTTAKVGKALKQSGVFGVGVLGATLLVVSLFNLSAPAQQATPETIIAGGRVSLSPGMAFVGPSF